MKTWAKFKETKYGVLMLQFFMKLYMEIAEVTANPKKQDGILILNTRKGYWIYKIFQREENLSDEKFEVCSDRYVKKIMNFARLKGKLIYLVDDTLVNGYSLLETYELLTEVIEKKYICPIVFALCDIVDLEKKRAESCGIEKEFWEKLKYFVRLSQDEIGDLCIEETKILHGERIPFIIDLPFLRPAEVQDEEMRFQITLTEKQFELLQTDTELWKFHFNDYIDEAGEKILQGFIIQMRDKRLLDAARDFAFDFVIEGTYAQEEHGKINVVFVPFAIVDSMEMEFLERLWKAMFAGDAQAEEEREKEYSLKNERFRKMSMGVRMHRECVYALSMMVARKFMVHFKELTELEMGYNYKILENHFPQRFIEIARKLEKELEKNPDLLTERIAQIPGKGRSEEVRLLWGNGKQPYTEAAAYDLIDSELLEKRISFLAKKKEGIERVTDAEAALEIGQINRILDVNYVYKSHEERRYALTRIVVTMLRISTCSNKLILSEDGKKLNRGFRYGENSDLFLPFFDIYFYWAVILYWEKYEEKQKAISRYDSFADALKNEYKRLKLMGKDITEEAFERNRKYYKNVLNNGLQIYNKTCYLEPYMSRKMSGTEIFYMEKMEEFVKKY